MVAVPYILECHTGELEYKQRDKLVDWIMYAGFSRACKYEYVKTIDIIDKYSTVVDVYGNYIPI